MKQVKFMLIFFLMLMLNVCIKAQNTGLEGSYLNIGTGNTLIENSSHLWGNAMGVNNYVGSANTLAVGNSDTINDYSVNAIALGGMNRVRGIASMSFGNTIKIDGDFSYGMGRYLKTNANNSIVFGNGFAGSGQNPDMFFENNYQNTLMIGLHSTKPTLTVSPSPNDYPQGDTLCKTGKVAIGDVPMPDIAAKLHIRSDYGENAGIILEPKDLTSSSTFIQMRDEYHGIWVDDNGDMKIISRSGFNYSRLLLEGKVGINVYDPDNMNPSYSLCVHGGILTDKIKIKNYSDWPDYVFNSGYPLMPLSDLKDYIYKNRHLPEVPSKKNVIEEGVEIGQMQDILLKKIEELTLYILQQQETMEELEQRIAELEEKNNNTTP